MDRLMDGQRRLQYLPFTFLKKLGDKDKLKTKP